MRSPSPLPGKRRRSDSAAPTPAPADRAAAEDPGAAPAPLSQGQRSLWFLQQLAPESGAYNIAAAARVRTPLDAAALERAAQALVDRHAALRTTFFAAPAAPVTPAAPTTPTTPVTAGEPRQRVAERLTFTLGREETAGWSAARLADRLAALAWAPFDLARGPLLRLTLLAGDAADPVLLLVIHHIVADFWTLAILMRELPVLYREAAGGAPARLGPPGPAYAEHVQQEEDLLAGLVGAERLTYWRERLAGLPTLELATDRPRPAVQTFRGDTRRLRLPAALASGLRALSRAHHGTLFMTLTAAWQALLGRHAGQEDFAVGTQRAGRAQTPFAGTVGYFVNSVVLRADLAGAPGFGALFARTRATVLAAFAQDYPLPLLAEHLLPHRDASRPPLFQVSLVLQKETRGVEGLTAFALGEEGVEVDLGELRFSSLSLGRAPAPFDLLLQVVERQGGLSLALQHNADLFDGTTAERFLERFALLLEAVAASPDQALSALPVLSAAERRQLLAWNAGQTVQREERTLQALFEAQVARAPRAPAVTLGGESWTYDELNRRANRLAWHLRRLGVGPEVRVGVLLDRSRELVVALLGILKAGGAYVPLDPTAPAERLELLCQDAALEVLVTHGGRDLPPVPAVAAVVDLDRLGAGSGPGGTAEGPVAADDRDPAPAAGPGNLCYVIYTSGSTGRPKGVLVRHGSVARLLSATELWFGFGPADVWTLFHSHAFDFSVWELWGALAYGGRLVVVPHWVSRSPAAFWRLLVEEGVTVLNQTPSAFRQLIAADGEAPAAERARLALRRVIFGGEALDLASLRPWYGLHDPAAPRLVNMYGITETTVHVTHRPLGAGDLEEPTGNPIGEAIPDLVLRLLDPRLELMPPGMVGEICVGGAGVARGYLGRPDLTAERFVPDPFAVHPGERLYRSGDRGRYRPDGQLDYLGRLDQQVKVRGFRIEPGEIEAALLTHPAVRAAVVLARQDLPGGMGLVAYLVCAAGAVAAAELRRLVAARLPDYMVPAAYLFLAALPQTVNGKLDRRALAALPLTGAGLAGLGGRGGAGAGVPRTPTEELVAGIFAEVLRVERLGIDEDFFALGGHSLMATQVTARVGAVFGVELPVRVVFEAPTAAGLAGRIDSIMAGSASGAGGASGGSGEREGPAPLTRVSYQERLTWISHQEPLTRLSRHEPLPLSFAQQRLWFLDLLEPGSPLYNVAGAVELRGRLDLVALRRALAEVVRRQEALRTTFRSVAGEPVQVVAPPPAPAGSVLPLVCLAGLPAARRRGEAQRLASAEARTPFALDGGARGPAPAGGPARPVGLLRVALLRSGAEQHTLLLTLHHIVSDRWSMGVLIRELGTLYAAHRAGRLSPLAELTVQYADFAAWQRRQLSGERLGAELSWWRQQLAGMPRVLELPADRPRPTGRGVRGAIHGFAISTEGLAGLVRLSRQQGATLFMTLLAGFGVVLGRHTGRDDLAVGTPVAGRNRVETEPLIGLFVNTLVLRLDLSGDPRFVELLGRVREATLSAHAHQELPFERLVEELVAERDGSRPPLVQVMLNVQNDLAASLELPGLALALSGTPTGTAKFELTCTLTETAGGLAGEIEYRRDLFDAATIARLAAGYARLLAGAVAEPGRRLAELPLLGAAERQQALVEWNDSESAYPRESCLSELFAAVAAARPEAPAVIAGVAGDEVWSYRRLDAASNRLARHLQSLGVAPEVPVAVSLERSAELIVAILAVVKAGGTYVPLDASHPDERLDHLLADSGAKVLLVHGRTRDRLAGHERRLALVAVDESGWEREEEHAEIPETQGSVGALGAWGALPVRVPAESLAYVIYTSGSTGQPKGVAVPHRAVVRLVLETNYLRLGPGDRVGQIANVSFDAATYEIWGALLTGAAAVVIPREAALSPPDLAALLRRQRVTSMFLTAALFTRMAREAPDAFADLHELLVGGDAVDPAAARAVLAAGPPRRLLNGYGPTESTTFAAWHRIDEVSPGASGVPIGLPLANTSLYVMDRGGEVVPLGACGELAIGGDGLARGYWNRPELTAERFVPHPWASGERLYRTGDLVRRRAAGPIEFLGRLDHQVKIRGFRVEPGEIEAVLRQHPGVREAAVVVVDAGAGAAGAIGATGSDTAVGGGGAGDRRLAAYVEAGAPAPAAEDLRRFVQEKLPAFMVPASFTVLPALPLSPNGKVDRRALAARAAGERCETTGGRGPRTPVEEVVAGIFAEQLARPVGAEDDFFALGGHSLLATRVVSRVRSVFGVGMAIRTLFEAPTVAGLAARIERLLADGTEEAVAAAAAPIGRISRQEPLPLSFAQQRLWFLDRLEPGSALYNVAAAVRLQGALNRGALAAAWSEIVRRHEVLRTRFLTEVGEPRQVIEPARAMALPVVDLTRLPAGARQQEEERLTREEARAPFDLTAAVPRAPASAGRPQRPAGLLRVTLLALSAAEQVALVTLHHIASDGWSVGVLTRELGALYTAFLQGLPSPLPELAIQYADFAAWQRRRLSGERLEAELAFWRERLAGAPGVLELPSDRPRPAEASHLGATHALTLGDGGGGARGATGAGGEVGGGGWSGGGGEALEHLKALSRRHGATLFMTLLTGFATLLARLSGQEEMVVGTAVAGRTRAETEPLIGFFVNTLALRVDLAGDPGFAPLLGQVRETTLAAYAHQEMPFERLVEELVPKRDASRPPLVQAMLILQNAPLGALALPGLELRVLPLGTGTAKFELTVALTETAGGLVGEIEYRRDLFDAATIARLAAGYARLLAGAVAEPGRRLAELPLLGAAERQQALVEWNDSASAYPRESCLAELFAAVAAARPEAPAVIAGVAGDEVWSYRRLDAASNRLARHLQSLGVAPEVPVAVSLERSAELIVAILAVVKAGGIYVPLDATNPDERLDYLLADSGAEVVLVHGRTRERLAGRGWLVAQVAVDEGGWEGEDPEAPEGFGASGASDTWDAPGAWDPLPVRVPAEALAYVIYTSGSTGQPKGVAVPHRAVVRLVLETNYLRLGPGDRVGLISNISFDVATYEIWGALLTGAAAVVIPRETVLSPPELAALVRRQRISSMFLTAALFTRMAQEIPEAFAGLHELLAGGDAVDPAAARAVLAAAPPQRLLNGYGPTESTGFASWHHIAEVPPGASGVPIGLPLANTTLYVMDRSGALAPLGARGELAIGGDGLAWGYWNRPELTAERFVPHPWVCGERLYRTGDLVRRGAAGPIEFLGRLDHQVKIRGFRVEPGEIEAVLRQHPGVREAAVVVVGGGAAGANESDTAVGGGGAGDRRLAAYVEAGAAAAPASDPGTAAAGVPAAEDLRRFVQGKLPAFMVPASFTVLPALPLSPNGKVDRRALAARAAAERWEAADGRGPRTPVEELVAGIFAELLGRPRVGAEDDFFALGGHSLLATRVVSRVRGVFGVEMAIRTLFAAPTVAGLAARIERLLAGGTEGAAAAAAPPIGRVSRQAPLPLSFAQQRLWFLDRLEPGGALYNVAAAVRLRGELNRETLAAAWSEIVRRHEVLRTRFLTEAGEPRQVIAPARAVALPVVDLAGLPAGARHQEEERLTREEARAPFDLTAAAPRAPASAGLPQRPAGLLRVTLLALSAAEQVALVTLHHIASDGWSVGVLTRELGALYAAYLRGLPSPLPELAIQYADFAAWQRELLSGGRLEAELKFWRERLAGAPRILELPSDRPRPAVASHPGATQALTLGDGGGGASGALGVLGAKGAGDGVRGGGGGGLGGGGAEALEDLLALSRRHGATLFMTLLAGFAVLLGRLGGQEEMVVGTAVAGRTRAETEPLIGFFVNTLALRVDLAGDPGFGSLLGQVRETTLAAYAHQELPFERLVEELVPVRDPSRPPLVQAMLVLQNASLGELSLPGLALHVLPVGTGTAKFELTVALTETAGGLAGEIEYRRDLFDATTIARLAAGYARLLDGVVAEPGRRLSELPLLDAAERRQAVQEPFAPSAGVAGAPPEAPAIILGDEVWSCRRLNAASNRLARHLRALGVAPQVLVRREEGGAIEILGLLPPLGRHDLPVGRT